MTHKPLLIFLLLLSLTNTADAGEKDGITHSRTLLKVYPLAPIASFYEALLPLSVEHKTANGRFSTNFELGIPLFYRTLSDYNKAGWQHGNPKQLKMDGRLRVDARVYLTPRFNRSWYAGIDVWYRHQSYKANYMGYHAPHSWNAMYLPESADVKKNVTSLAVIWGFQRHFTKRFTLELQTGVGAKYIQIDRSNIVGQTVYYNQYPLLSESFYIGEDEDAVNYSVWNLSLPWAVRLCYNL